MKFENFETSKKEKLLKALIEEYATQGYANASTNIIVKNAGISKGSLFNYFGNKKSQYLFLIEYVMIFLQNRMKEYMVEVEFPTGYFEQLLFKSQLKIRLGLEYPLEYKLLLDAYLEEDQEVKDFISTQYAMFSAESIEVEKSGLNPDDLKNPEDRDKIVEMVFYLIAGYSETYIKKHKDLDTSNIPEILGKMTDDLISYFNIIQREFFK